MINVVDLIVGIFILFYLLRNAGGVVRTLKNFIVIFLALVLFGIVTQLLLSWSFVKPIHKTLENSYFVDLSYVLIKWFYPVIEKQAPKIDTFIKEKIISAPTPEVAVPKIILPEKTLPKLSIPELPKLK